MKTNANGKRVKGSGVREVYESLRKEILTLGLEPGALLDEKTLADRFKLSRSPVREALIRLAGEGLVVTLANRSTLVAPFDLTTFPKYIEALDLSQRVNTRLAAQLRTEPDIAKMRECQESFREAVRRNDYLEMTSTNKAFHMAIAAAGKNPYLAQQYGRLLDEGRRMLHLHFDYLTQSEEEDLLTNEHDNLIEAVVDQDIERADQLAHAHTRQFRDRFFNFLQQNFAHSMPITPSLD